MNKDWLWDKNISKEQAVRILRNPEHPQFIFLSSTLLSRKNTPQEIFRDYLQPDRFCRNWTKIKRKMRQDSWNNPRIEFWQAVYERLLEKFHVKGIDIFTGGKEKHINPFCFEIGQRIKTIRKRGKLTQEMLSKKLDISQQMISRIESGGENISILTLKKIIEKLGVNISDVIK